MKTLLIVLILSLLFLFIILNKRQSECEKLNGLYLRDFWGRYDCYIKFERVDK